MIRTVRSITTDTRTNTRTNTRIGISSKSTTIMVTDTTIRDGVRTHRMTRGTVRDGRVEGGTTTTTTMAEIMGIIEITMIDDGRF